MTSESVETGHSLRGILPNQTMQGPALHEALHLQRQAYLAQPMPSLAERRADLRQLAGFVKENLEGLVAAVSADYGHRSRHETLLMEIGPLLASIRHALSHLRAWMKPQRRGIDRLTYGLGQNRVIPQPLGVVGVIVPWNFPINLSLIPLVYVFAAGNRAMLKMSENSRHLAQFLIERMPAYFAPDKLQVFDETGGVGIEFSKLPFDHLLFTGSGATGRAVMAAAAQNLCPVTLELGGKAPAIVCDDFDLRTAAERILMIKCLNAGQICTTVDHVYLPENSIDAFVQHAQRIVPQRYPGLEQPVAMAQKAAATPLQQMILLLLRCSHPDQHLSVARVTQLLPMQQQQAILLELLICLMQQQMHFRVILSIHQRVLLIIQATGAVLQPLLQAQQVVQAL